MPMDSKMLDRCRAVEYTKGPAGRKGSRKCAECGFYFVPSEEKYPFYDVGGPPPDGTVLRTGIDWYEETRCCPNCEPYRLRRCLGRQYHSRGGTWAKRIGCGQWFHLDNEYERKDEIAKINRRKVCRSCNWNTQSKAREHYIQLGITYIEHTGHAPPQHGVIDSRHIRRIWGTWNSYISALGCEPLEPGHSYSHGRSEFEFKQKYTTPQILAELKSAGLQHGRALSPNEWDAEHRSPHSRTIQQRLGSWSEAWQLVGYTPYSQTPEYKEKRRYLGVELARMMHGSDAGRPAYEILNDPDSEYNCQRQEIAAKQKRYEREMAEAAERFERAKFRKKEVEEIFR